MGFGMSMSLHQLLEIAAKRVVASDDYGPANTRIVSIDAMEDLKYVLELIKVTRDAMNWIDVDAIAKTVWGEARGESAAGQMAVVHVILNRTKTGRWGERPNTVCTAPKQFSCWNANDPNSRVLSGLDFTRESYAETVKLVLSCLSGKYADPTNGATHYFNPEVADPSWAKEAELCGIIGRHHFYRNVP